MTRHIAKILPLACALLTPAVARADAWEIDSSHSRAQFGVRHLMVSTVRGDLGKVTGQVDFDAKNPAVAKVDATIDVTGIDTRDAKRDEHLRSPDFFDTGKYPNITFKSKRVEKVADGKFKLVGDLTMRGVTKEVSLDVDGPSTAIKDPWGNTRVGASATGKINRKDFGIQWNKALDAGGVALGDDVQVTLDVELVKKGAPAAAPAKTPAKK